MLSRQSRRMTAARWCSRWVLQGSRRRSAPSTKSGASISISTHFRGRPYPANWTRSGPRWPPFHSVTWIRLPEISSHLSPISDPGSVLRRRAPQAVVVLGGSAFTLFSRRIMEEVPEADIGVPGEAEGVLPKLLENLAAPGAVPGVLWRKEGGVESSGAGIPIAWMSIPCLCPLGKYLNPAAIGAGTATLPLWASKPSVDARTRAAIAYIRCSRGAACA